MQQKQAYGTKPHGGVVAKALEPSPVVSNTTQHHDPLAGAVQSVLKREFKVGDRVRCVAGEDTFGDYYDDAIGSVTDVGTHSIHGYMVFVNWEHCKDVSTVFAWDYELELIEGER